jgi:hypothetical protein
MATKTTRYILKCAVISVILVVGFNYFIDPFGIFKTDLIPDYAINERYRKVDFLLRHPQQFNSLLLGSSVVGLFNPETATRLSKDRAKFYNLSYLGGTPKESYQSVAALQSNGFRLKEVIVGIDLFAFKDIDKPYGPADHPHPIVTGESPVKFTASYLFASSFYQGFNKITHAFKSTPDIRFNPEEDGHYQLVKYDNDIQTDHATFIEKHLKHAVTPKGVPVWIPQRFTDLKVLVELLKNNGVKARYFIHPQSHLLTEAQPPSTMETFRTKIKDIIPDVYDFSDYAQITNNDCLFYDIKHYRPVVADKIMQAIMNEDRIPEHLKLPASEMSCLNHESKLVTMK